MSTRSRRTRLLALILVPVASLIVVGGSWAVASPPGSSADDGYHLTSIWCAWGDSESCRGADRPGPVLVPDRVATPACFALQNGTDARCTWLLTGELIRTEWYNTGGEFNPPMFYATMRLFVGTDVARSVVVMRLVNSLLAAAMLLWALAVARPTVRRALLVSWGAALIPVGIFFIASTNPSGWVITGVGLYWAFVLTLLHEKTVRSRRAVLALGGAIVTAGMAIGARSDALYFILLSSIAVVVLSSNRFRGRVRHRWHLVTGLLAALAIILVIAWNTRAASFLKLSGQLNFPPGDAARDQPNAILKTLLEFPSFMAAMLGGQAPLWTQRSSALDGGTPGYSWPGFTYGVGYVDVHFPSIVGVLGIGAVTAIIIIGFQGHSPRKLIAATLIFLGIVGEVLFLRAIYGFSVMGQTLQPRYFLPIVLALIGICLLVYPSSRELMNRAQALILVCALALSSSIALRATMARYIHGQDHSYTQFSDLPRWWWPSGPSPDVVWIVGSFASLIWIASTVYVGRRGSSSKLRASTLN